MLPYSQRDTLGGMYRRDFHYRLPPERIATYPAAERVASRLLCLDAATGAIGDRRFADIVDLLRPEDLLVFNDTRVMKARFYGHKDSGGAVEVLLERVLSKRRATAQIRASKPPRSGTRITLAGGPTLEVLGRHEEFFEVRLCAAGDLFEVMATCGHVPLPPYLHRPDEAVDEERYQTVFARRLGAVAAPTAGLHFDWRLLAAIKEKGIAMAFVTLHVGAGTFEPVREERIDDHRMHRERMEVTETVCREVRAARRRGGRVIAVGTTSVRALEAASAEGALRPYCGETDIFIYPGYRFKTVAAMITNFHLPESTLLMLVCAFAGREPVLRAYRHAIAEGYRFYSYGDAMWVSRI